MNNKNKGIGSLIPTELTPAEKKSDELAQWAIRNIDRGDWRSRQKENELKTVHEVDPLDVIPSINLGPLKTTEEPKNKFGHTKAQKNKMVHEWNTRPRDNIKKMVEKSMPITTYIDKMSVLYGGQEKRKVDDQGKPLMKKKTNTTTPGYKYLSWEDSLKEKDQDQKDKIEIRNKKPGITNKEKTDV